MFWRTRDAFHRSTSPLQTRDVAYAAFALVMRAGCIVSFYTSISGSWKAEMFWRLRPGVGLSTR